MSIASTILDQLGGNKFIVMTGSKNFISDGYTLRMSLAKNQTKANRLEITLTPDDLYTMRFYKYTAPRLSRKTWTFSEEKIEEIKVCEGIYNDMLQDVFTMITGMATHF